MAKPFLQGILLEVQAIRAVTSKPLRRTIESYLFIVNPKKLEHRIRMIHAGTLYTYFKGTRLMMFQLSGFCCTH